MLAPEGAKILRHPTRDWLIAWQVAANFTGCPFPIARSIARASWRRWRCSGQTIMTWLDTLATEMAPYGDR